MRFFAAIAAVSVTVILSGCADTSTPTPEGVSAELKPYYAQTLSWTSCEDGMQCATAVAPLDWSRPASGDIEIALVRHKATGISEGSLLVNPGGPGGSGYDFVAQSLDYATSPELQERFDIVGFDPRGVGRSSAVSCLAPAEMDSYLYDLAINERGSDAWISEVTQANLDFAAACLESSGSLLEFVDTESAARDLDMLRAALGDQQLNYLGYSYGTYLGAVYAELFPDKVGRLVLDGATDPAASVFEVNVAQAQGFESALRAYLTDCLGSFECPFSGTVDEGMISIRALLDAVESEPLTASDGRQLGADSLLTAIIYPLYSPDSWEYLSQMLQSVIEGDADYAFQFADGYNGREPDGTYLDNSTEAFRAINCLDYSYNANVESMREQAAFLEQAAPTIGRYFGFGDISCDVWPFQTRGERVALDANGSNPILVVGTTNDPATPYQWAVNLAEQLDNAVLVTYVGEGHTAYNKSNSCVNDTVDAYLIDGVVPPSNVEC